MKITVIKTRQIRDSFLNCFTYYFFCFSFDPWLFSLIDGASKLFMLHAGMQLNFWKKHFKFRHLAWNFFTILSCHMEILFKISMQNSAKKYRKLLFLQNITFLFPQQIAFNGYLWVQICDCDISTRGHFQQTAIISVRGAQKRFIEQITLRNKPIIDNKSRRKLCQKNSRDTFRKI